MVYFCDLVSGQCYCGFGVDNCYDWDLNFFNGLVNLQGLLQLSNIGIEVDVMNNKFKVLYLDQLSFGMFNQLGDWFIDVMVICVMSYDGFVFILGNCYFNGDFFQNQSQFWGNGVFGFGLLIIGNNVIEMWSIQVLLLVNKLYDQEFGWGVIFVYMFICVIQNCDINEYYLFDEVMFVQYLFIDFNVVVCYCFVVIGVIDGLWGIMMFVKLMLVMLILGNMLQCYSFYVFFMGSNCILIVGIFSGNGKFFIGGKVFGYCDVDFQVIKNFDFGYGLMLYGCFDVFNVFNFKNYLDLIYIVGLQLYQLMMCYNFIGDIIFVLCIFKFEVGMKF